MLGEVFYWLLNMSITASVTGCVVWLVRRVRRLPRRMAVWLWCIPLVRMWVPLGIGSDYGLMSLLARITTRTVTVYDAQGWPDFTMTNHVMGAESYFPIVYKVDLLENIFAAAGVVWAIVTLAAVAVLYIVYVTTMRALRDAVHLRDRVYLSGRVDFPAVYGVVRPRIVVPTAHREKDLTFVVMH